MDYQEIYNRIRYDQPIASDYPISNPSATFHFPLLNKQEQRQDI